MGIITKQHQGQKSSTCAELEVKEHCNKGVCRFRNIDGTCVFESCLYDERPTETGNLNFKCSLCTEETSRPDRELVIGTVCKEEEEKLPIVGKKTYNCIFCDAESSVRKVPYHNICNDCIKEIIHIIRNRTCC